MERREISGHQPISVKQHLQQWRRGHLKKRTPKGVLNINSEGPSFVLSSQQSEVTTSSADYNTLELANLVLELKEKHRSSGVVELEMSDYTVLPDFYNATDQPKKVFATQQSFYSHTDTSCSEDDENAPCSSQQAYEREAQTGLICPSYVGPKQAHGTVTLKYGCLTNRKDASTLTNVTGGQRPLYCSKPNSKTTTSKVRRAKPGCFKARYIRGRARLDEIRTYQSLGNSSMSSTARTEFLTLTEVLVENGISENTVICCSLCRLLISKTLREEFFMQPCDCPDKFVHTECALLNQYEMLRQKCPDCHKFKTDRIVCRSRPPSPSRTEEVALYRLNAEMVKPTSKPLYRRRLPDEFEHDCHICFDKRLIRDDRYEKLDSKVVRACKCRVTGHNQCIAKSLLRNRNCRYCGYRIKYELGGPEMGCCSLQILIPTILQILITLSVAVTLLYWTLSNTQFESKIADKIFKLLITVITPSSAIFVVAWLCKGWIIRSKRTNEKAKIVIKEFKLPKAIKGRKITEKWEEIGFGGKRDDVAVEIDI